MAIGSQRSSAIQGFIQFRLSGEPLRLGVDDLNERLKVRGAQRMRQAFRPDEAHAALFNFDGNGQVIIVPPCVSS